MGIINMFLNLILDVFSILLIIRIVMSFLNMGRHSSKIAEVTYDITDVVLNPIQKVLKPVRLGDYYLDFAPLVVLIIINIIQNLI
ncbi:MAG: YggT family protein [Halanaerobiales bacterium]